MGFLKGSNNFKFFFGGILLQLSELRFQRSNATMHQLVQRGQDLDLDNACVMESDLFGLSFSTEDRTEGMAAFLENRAFEGVEVLPAQKSKRLVSADGAFTSRALFPYDMARQSEFYEIRLKALGEEVSSGNGPGIQENLVVAQGVLEVSVNEERYLLSTGDSILFYADQPHRYRNPADSEAVAFVVITYPEPLD